ncbi:UNVERIFIED_CONTAM: hypothetical protein PYX00_003584 [Menopon gallinae]|uniref:Uncharacterized protein n=1 Tax=Menopon gallinae TaxID=328185 RepID=A0AAW2I347_9NEOP
MNREDGIVTENKSSDEPVVAKVLLSCLRNGNGSSSNNAGKNTRVSFPDDERDLVTGYLEPVNPWDIGPVSTEDLVALYEESCQKHGTTPLEHVIHQLKVCYSSCPNLEVCGPLDLASLEALETILARLRFQCLRINSVELNDDAAVALFDMLEYYESTCKLSISCDNGLGPRSWQACSRLIKKAHCLEELEVKATPLNEQVMIVFCKALKVGSKLSSLTLSRCGLSGRYLIILTEALKFNTSVQALTLADNNLTPSDAVQLGALLRTNNTLRFLDISNNVIEDSGCEHLCKGLAEQTGEGLEALVLWNTHLTENCGPHLALLLSSSSPLETLNIGQNNISTGGLVAMKSAMIRNHHLKQLGVQSAKINCEGVSALAEVLKANAHLRRIDARSNEIGPDGLRALKAALEAGAKVHRIDLDDSQGESQSLIEEIRECCRLNEAKFHVEEELENSRSFSFSRKISLTCETLMMRNHLEANNNFLGEPKRAGRLRSPEPSPIPSPASSPLPSPSRHRFRVSRVSESSSDGSSLSPSSPVPSRFRVTLVEPSGVHSDVNTQKVGFEFPCVKTEVQPATASADGPAEDAKPAAPSDNHVPPASSAAKEPPSSSDESDASDQRRRKVSVSKPQTGLEKLLGLFQNPGGLFGSVSISGDKQKELKHFEDDDKNYDKENREFWDWDWSSPISKKDSNRNANSAEEACSVSESHAENHNI